MINHFINELAARESTNKVFNPYQDSKVKNNLRAYIIYMMDHYKNGVLLVGEAPGHKGCKITGIPFTSGAVIESKKHTIFSEIGREIHLSKIETENTARIVWNYLEDKKSLPLFWNSFPFHPHPENIKNKNRQPNHDEINEGLIYLKKLVHIFNPRIIAGIGRSGTKCAQQAFADRTIDYIRHPSFGGKKDFLNGIKKII